MMTVSTAVVALLSAALRWRGFALRHSFSAASNTEMVDEIAPHQFGLKHMLIWATAVVPLLIVLRGVNLVVFRDLAHLEIAFAAMLVAASVATVNLIAIWSVLGSGWWIARGLMLVGGPSLIAAGMASYSRFLRIKYGIWSNLSILDTLIDMREHWFAWLWLDAALLAALLLFVRASGYRLLRTIGK